MIDDDDLDARLRDTLRAVANATPSDASAPPLRDGRVAPIRDRRRRWIAIAAAAAVVALAAGLTIARADDHHARIHTADVPTTRPSTTATTVTTTTASTGPSTTAVPSSGASAPPATARQPIDSALIASGDGWGIARVDDPAKADCFDVYVRGVLADEHCGVDLANGVIGDTLNVPLDGSTSLSVALTSASISRVDDPTSVAQSAIQFIPFADGVQLAITVWSKPLGVLFLYRASDTDIFAVVDGFTAALETPSSALRVRTGPPLGQPGWVQLSLQPAFNGGTASYTDIGRYPGANGAACVRIRELLPDLRTLLDRCDLTAPSGSPVGQFTLAPSQFDGAMWLVGVADRMVSWGCTLPSGAACGGGMSVAIDDQQSYWLVLGTGPVTVMDGGVRADHVTLTFDDVLTGKPLAQVDVAVPPA